MMCSIKNSLRRSFADKANDFALTLNTLSLAISGLEGDVDDQCRHVQRLNSNLPPLDAFLETLALLDQQCEEANIDENDFTTYTYDDLAYEFGLVKSSMAKKLSFLENQMVARNMTNLTPIQLEEFESVFRHFDRDLTNSLQELEFSAALASLSLVYDEDEMHDNFVAISAGTGCVTFEQFIRFMVNVTEDQNTAEQVFQSFAEVADGKVREESISLILPFPAPRFLLLKCCLLCIVSSNMSFTKKVFPPFPTAVYYRTRPAPFPHSRRSGRRSSFHDAGAQRS